MRAHGQLQALDARRPKLDERQLENLMRGLRARGDSRGPRPERQMQLLDRALGRTKHRYEVDLCPYGNI